MTALVTRPAPNHVKVNLGPFQFERWPSGQRWYWLNAGGIWLTLTRAEWIRLAGRYCYVRRRTS